MKRDRDDPKLLQFFRHKKDQGGMSSYRVKELIVMIRILIHGMVVGCSTTQFETEFQNQNMSARLKIQYEQNTAGQLNKALDS